MDDTFYMPRVARNAPQDCTIHVIARFIDHQPMLDLPGARAKYIERLESALEHHDARLFAFSLMSTHLHLVLHRMRMALGDLFEQIHTAFAQWVRSLRGGLGSVFAGRFKSIPFEPELVPILTSYVHNNEQRAGLVDDPIQSRWSSHMYFRGERKPPPWLRVDEALERCGFDSSPAGRADFDEMVRSRTGDPKLSTFSRVVPRHRRLGELAAAGIPVGLAHVGREPSASPPSPGSPPAPRWPGRVRTLVEITSLATGLSESDIRSGLRHRELAYVRGAMLLAWRQELGRPLTELTPLVRVASSSASKALARARHSVGQTNLARELARLCRNAS
jgi:hypothetical protein